VRGMKELEGFNGSMFNGSSFNESGFQESSFNSNLTNSTFNESQFSKTLMSGLNMSVSKTFCCKELDCDFLGFSSLQLSAHNRSTHYTSECDECGKKYANEACLKQHKQRVHQKVTKVKCKLCNQGFYSKTALGVHNKNCNGYHDENHDFSLDETFSNSKINHYDKTAQNQEKYRLHCTVELKIVQRFILV